MSQQLLIAGAGMGGLATALAASRAGWKARVHEQAAQLSEVGAGIQLGPNATRILREWGLSGALDDVAFAPQQLRAHSALDGRELGAMRLGSFFMERYGAPYLTIHRADLQNALMDAALRSGAHVELGSRLTAVAASPTSVTLTFQDGAEAAGDALVGADGLWSVVRALIWRDAGPGSTGHVAYRALASRQSLPASLRSSDVRVWLGPRLHVVAYPVRAGELLNVVAIVQTSRAGIAREGEWDQHGSSSDLHAAMGLLCKPLQELVAAMPAWRLWVLHDRPPLRSAGEMAQGRVALLGDAAHPMRPYLAQGAAMAIEDAAELGSLLSRAVEPGADVAQALERYAANRWERCAKVQARAQRNGRIFHATGLVRWGRDTAMRMLGERLLDQPWLYR
jgi:salicylate hydroxylase